MFRVKELCSRLFRKVGSCELCSIQDYRIGTRKHMTVMIAGGEIAGLTLALV